MTGPRESGATVAGTNAVTRAEVGVTAPLQRIVPSSAEEAGVGTVGAATYRHAVSPLTANARSNTVDNARRNLIESSGFMSHGVDQEDGREATRGTPKSGPVPRVDFGDIHGSNGSRAMGVRIHFGSTLILISSTRRVAVLCGRLFVADRRTSFSPEPCIFMFDLRFSHFAVLLLGLSLLLFTACDSGSNDSDPANQPAEFAFTLSDDGSDTNLAGSATWTEGQSNQGDDAFGLLFNSSDNTSSSFLTRLGPAPSPGTYSIASLQSTALVPVNSFTIYVVTDAGGSADLPTTYISRGGDVTIDEAGDTFISGRVDIDLVRTEIVNGQPQEFSATLEGSFNAQEVSSIGIIQ